LLMHKIGELALILLLGFLLVKVKILRPEDSTILAKLNLYLIMPLAVFKAFLVEHTAEAYVGFLVSLVAAVVVHLFLMLFAEFGKRILGMDGVEQGSIFYPNSGNLLIPIVTAAMGPEWVLYTSPFMVVQTLFIYTHGVNLFVREKGVLWKRLLLTPFLWAIVGGFVFFLTGLSLPTLVMDCVVDISGMVGPISMLIIGMLFAAVDLKSVLRIKRMYLVLAFRLIVIPLILLVLLGVSGVADHFSHGREILLVTFLAASAPSAASVTQFAQIYGGDAKYASAINIFSTLLCVITMPALVWLYEWMI